MKLPPLLSAGKHTSMSKPRLACLPETLLVLHLCCSAVPGGVVNSRMRAGLAAAVLFVCCCNAVARSTHARLLLQQECNATAAKWSYEGADCPSLLPDCEQAAAPLTPQAACRDAVQLPAATLQRACVLTLHRHGDCCLGCR